MVVTPPEPPSADAALSGAAGEPPAAAAAPTSPALESARRAVESIVIAVATSTGVYLIGSVYTDAYYGRMSIDATALDLAPPYIALQAVHVVQSLLVYPVLLLGMYLLYRAAAGHLPRAQAWVGRQPGVVERLALLGVNGLVVFPLLQAAAGAGANRALIQTTSALSEVASLMQFAGFVLAIYVVWLSLGPRRLLLGEIRRHQLVPIVLLAALYFLGALVHTADRARANAERLMTGESDASMAVTFTMAANAAPAPSAELLLVAVRNGQYFVVERQDLPPSRTPKAHAIPVGAINGVEMERVNPAGPSAEGIVIEVFPTTPAP